MTGKKIKSVLLYRKYLSDYLKFKNGPERNDFPPLSWPERFPCLHDRTSATDFDRHYVYHTAWAARVLADTRPREHTDISSSLYFSSIVSAFVPIRFYDFRPPVLELPGLTCGAADILSLPLKNESIQSLSCMHVVEHIGLGRYGDPIDPEGDIKAIIELKRVLAKNGNLLFVVPIGRPKIKFNAHRIYSYDQIIDYFSDFKLREFILIPDSVEQGGLIYRAAREIADKQTYGCGCFWFVRT